MREIILESFIVVYILKNSKMTGYLPFTFDKLAFLSPRMKKVLDASWAKPPKILSHNHHIYHIKSPIYYAINPLILDLSHKI